MAQLLSLLQLSRCPHCQIDNPNLTVITGNKIQTNNVQRSQVRDWKVYACSRCGGAVLAGAVAKPGGEGYATEIYPRPAEVDSSLPKLAKEYLTQAINSVHSPAGAVMLCASAVDAMLKDKGYNDPKHSLYKRIELAATAHLITESMKDWAHEIRLDANDQRYADQGAVLPTTADAQRNIEFAQALGQFLYALPARVAQGRAAVQISSATVGQTNVSTPRTSPGLTQADVDASR